MEILLLVLTTALALTTLAIAVTAARKGLLVDEEMARDLDRRILHQRRMLLEPQAARILVRTRPTCTH